MLWRPAWSVIKTFIEEVFWEGNFSRDEKNTSISFSIWSWAQLSRLRSLEDIQRETFIATVCKHLKMTHRIRRICEYSEESLRRMPSLFFFSYDKTNFNPGKSVDTRIVQVFQKNGWQFKSEHLAFFVAVNSSDNLIGIQKKELKRIRK